MDFLPISDYEIFHSLLEPYYREGEDAQTPQEELDGFIRYLYSLVEDNTISGAIAWQGRPVGFALWAVDREELPFSNLPGAGTILEIGVIPECRSKGYGKLLAEYAEKRLSCEKRYVCAYGPAESFWKKQGYADSGMLATNGLKLFVK